MMGAQDDFVAWLLREADFIEARRLTDGTYVGVLNLMFTKGLCIGITPLTSYERRYCYESLGDALAEYRLLQTGDDVPSGWIARRPELPEDIAAKALPDYDPRQFWPERK
jgi:hypothetical protein